MKLDEVRERLQISNSTLYRYRKSLGIFEETRANVSPSQFEELRKLRDRRSKYSKTNDAEFEKQKLKDLKAVKSDGAIKINVSDSVEVQNLKQQHNDNLDLIVYLNRIVRQQMNDLKVPEKYLIDSIEKYQKLNMLILNTLQRLNPEEDDLKKMIAERLGTYGKD